MQIQISAQHFSLGQSLQGHIRNKLLDHVTKYFDHTVSCQVHINKTSYSFLCDIVAHTGAKTTIISDAQNTDVYASFDLCLAKLDERLRRYKSKLQSHHHKTKLSSDQDDDQGLDDQLFQEVES